MWIYVVEGSTSVWEGNEYINLPDGKMLLLNEYDHSQFHVHNDGYFKTTSALNYLTGQESNGPVKAIIPAGGGMKKVTRLDYFNCRQWGWCSPNGGSKYSVNETIKVYNDDGSTHDYIYSDEKILFDVGYGYTKGNTINQDVQKVRVSGKIQSSGTGISYYGTKWADTDPRQSPSNYGVNTF